MKPVSRREFIRRLRILGYEGPEAGGKHPQMHKGAKYISVTNPHSGDMTVDLMKRILRAAGISEKDWIKAGDE